MMPHITEEIWQRVPKWDGAEASIMISRFPSALVDAKIDRDAERDFALVQAFVGSARTIRAEHDVPKSHPDEDSLARRGRGEAQRSWKPSEPTIERLARCQICFEPDGAKLDDPTERISRTRRCSSFPGVRAVVPGVIDTEKERDRLQRDLKKVEKELGRPREEARQPELRRTRAGRGRRQSAGRTRLDPRREARAPETPH